MPHMERTGAPLGQSHTVMHLKKNADCGAICCALMMQGVKNVPVCILEEKHKTKNLFVAHKCALLGRIDAFNMILYDVHHCFICFSNNSTMACHCILTSMRLYILAHRCGIVSETHR